MKKIFADTSGGGHLVDSRQKYHGMAANICLNLRNKGSKIVTGNYIIAKPAAFMMSPLYHSVIADFMVV